MPLNLLGGKYAGTEFLTFDGSNSSGNTVTKGSSGDTFLNVNNRRINGLQATPVTGSEATSKTYVDTQIAAISAGAGVIKETILSSVQLSNTQGIRPAFLLFLPTGSTIIAGEIITLVSDTHAAATFEEGVDFTGGVSATADMQALATAINASTNFGAYYSNALDKFNATDGAIVVYTKTTPGANDDFRAYSSTGSSNVDVVSYWATTATDTAQTTPAENYTFDMKRGSFSINNGDPGANVDYSGKLYLQASLTEPQTHVVLAENEWWTWDADASQWNLSSFNSVPDATSNAGGTGTKGKVTVDENYALYVASGILRLQLETSNPTLEFGTGTPKQLKVKYGTSAGLTQNSNGLAILLASSSGLLLNTSGLQILLDSTTNASSGLAKSSNGLYVKLQAAGSGTGGLAYAAADAGLAVDPSDGIALDANGVKVNLTSNAGLQFTGAAGSGTLGAKVDTSSVSFVTATGSIQVNKVIEKRDGEILTLSGGDITNGYKALGNQPVTEDAVTLQVIGSTGGSIQQEYGVQFTIMNQSGVYYVVWKTSGTGLTGTHPSSGLVGDVVAGDKLAVNYSYANFTPAA